MGYNQGGFFLNNHGSHHEDIDIQGSFSLDPFNTSISPITGFNVMYKVKQFQGTSMEYPRYSTIIKLRLIQNIAGLTNIHTGSSKVLES